MRWLAECALKGRNEKAWIEVALCWMEQASEYIAELEEKGGDVSPKRVLTDYRTVLCSTNKLSKQIKQRQIKQMKGDLP